ncbi:rootletin-like [Branchiostoma floridae x Branchiostoma japonicum]
MDSYSFYFCAGEKKHFLTKLHGAGWKLEDSVLGKGEEEPYTIRRGDSPGSTRVPARIREIITKNLSEEDVSSPDGSEGMQPQVAAVQEENRMLQNELGRVEDLLAQSRAERDEVTIKYNAVSEREKGPL